MKNKVKILKFDEIRKVLRKGKESQNKLNLLNNKIKEINSKETFDYKKFRLYIEEFSKLCKEDENLFHEILELFKEEKRKITKLRFSDIFVFIIVFLGINYSNLVPILIFIIILKFATLINDIIKSKELDTLKQNSISLFYENNMEKGRIILLLKNLYELEQEYNLNDENVDLKWEEEKENSYSNDMNSDFIIDVLEEDIKDVVMNSELKRNLKKKID